MMGVLTRLVARGKGAADPGLTPRIAARFEKPVEDSVAMSETLREAPTIAPFTEDASGFQALKQPFPSVAAAPSVRRTDPLNPGATKESEPQVPRLMAPRPAVDLSRSKPNRTSDASEIETPVAAEQKSSPDPVLAPVVPEIESKRGTENRDLEEAPLQRVEAGVPPAPLLPSETRPDGVAENSSPFSGALIPQPAVTGRPQTDSPQMQEPPEIVVHIGRIDIRSDSAPQAPAKPRKNRQPQMTPLGDYLKSRGGAG